MQQRNEIVTVLGTMWKYMKLFGNTLETLWEVAEKVAGIHW